LYNLVNNNTDKTYCSQWALNLHITPLILYYTFTNCTLRLGLAFRYPLYYGKYVTLNTKILHLQMKMPSRGKISQRHWHCKLHVNNSRHHTKQTRQSFLHKNTWRWSLFRTFIASFTTRSWFRLSFQRLSFL